MEGSWHVFQFYWAVSESCFLVFRYGSCLDGPKFTENSEIEVFEPDN